MLPRPWRGDALPFADPEHSVTAARAREREEIVPNFRAAM